MISLQLNKKDVFDSLWRWAKTYMQHTDPSDPRYGYFAWHCNVQGGHMDENPASDGETWFATALFFASVRWGNGGEINYEQEANTILYAAMHKEVNGTVKQSVYNMFSSEEQQVVFTPYASAATYTDPSYHIPTFYRVWATMANESNDFYTSLEVKSRDYFQTAADADTGLFPDYSDFDGSPYGSGQNFKFDAWRTLAYVATDYAWFGKEAGSWAITESDRLLQFFYSRFNDTSSYGNQYSLDGRQLSGDHSTGLVAMNAVGALASTDSIAWEFVEALWNTSIPTGEYRY